MNKILILCVLSALSTNVWAAENSDFLSYDDIISELSGSGKTKARVKNPSNDPFADVKMHAGVGFINSNVNIMPAPGQSLSSSLRGVEASLAIDLFHKNWAAEGAIRAFGTQQSKDAEVSLREFDLRLLYRTEISYKVNFRAGTGIAARYLNYTDLNSPTAAADRQAFQETMDYDYTTPSSIMFVGLEGFLTEGLSLAAEIGYRSSLIDDTADRNTLEATFKLETHF